MMKWLYRCALVILAQATLLTSSPISASGYIGSTLLYRATDDVETTGSIDLLDTSNRQASMADDIHTARSTTTDVSEEATSSAIFRNNVKSLELTTPINPASHSPDQTSVLLTQIFMELATTVHSLNDSSDVSSKKFTSSNHDSQENSTPGKFSSPVPDRHVWNNIENSSNENQNMDIQAHILNNYTHLKLLLQNNGDNTLVTWLFDSNDTKISGFHVSYKESSGEEYDSPLLDKTARTLTLHSLHKDENYVICVSAIDNGTVVKDACADWSEQSLKIVMGIFAGVLFLIPCLIVTVWILRKDRKIRKEMELMSDEVITEQTLFVVSNKGSVKGQAGVESKKYDEKSCVAVDEETKSHSAIENHNKCILQEEHKNGTENPCIEGITIDEDNIPAPEKMEHETGDVNKSAVNVRL